MLLLILLLWLLRCCRRHGHRPLWRVQLRLLLWMLLWVLHCRGCHNRLLHLLLLPLFRVLLLQVLPRVLQSC